MIEKIENCEAGIWECQSILPDEEKSAFFI
jgi:hypothetical protein